MATKSILFILFSGPKWNHGPWGHSRGNVSQGKKFFFNIIKIACETSVLGCLQIGLIVFTPKISVLQDLKEEIDRLERELED